MNLVERRWEPDMSMRPMLRKSVLVLHVATSVGWMGAVAAFLALAVVGLAAAGESDRGLYAAMDVIAWWVILPLALASLAIGVVQAVGTPWGLLRHNWVVAKLLLTTVAVAVLVAKLALISQLADSGSPAALDGPSLMSARLEVVVHAGGPVRRAGAVGGQTAGSHLVRAPARTEHIREADSVTALQSDAVVKTERAERYIEQLRKHLAHGPGGVRAEQVDTELVIYLGRSTCRIRAVPEGMSLHAEAPDERALADVERRIAARIEQIGRRDGLRVMWRPAAPGAAISPLENQ